MGVPSAPRSGLIRVIALFLLLAGGTLSSLEFVLHCSAAAESAHHVEAAGSRTPVHRCLGTAISGASITPAFDARTLIVPADGLRVPAEIVASRLALAPSTRPTSRAPPPIPA